MKTTHLELINSIKNYIDERIEYHLQTGDCDTAAAIACEFHEWFDDSCPCEVIGLSIT